MTAEEPMESKAREAGAHQVWVCTAHPTSAPVQQRIQIPLPSHCVGMGAERDLEKGAGSGERRKVERGGKGRREGSQEGQEV